MKKVGHLETVWKGMAIGGTMLVPGASGGSMAMILGIYDRLISAVSSFKKDIKGNLLFLILFVLGAGVGMLLFAKPLLGLIEVYPKPTLYFFLGAVAGGIPFIYKEAQVEGFAWRYPVYIVSGFLIVRLLAILPLFLGEGVNAGNGSMGRLAVFGIIAATALVLPGISVSYLLLMFGIYESTMRAISEMNLSFLMPLGIGVVIGILLVTRGLEIAMTKHPKPTYLIILGFVIGSLIETFPGIPVGFEWIMCILTAVLGYSIIRRISA